MFSLDLFGVFVQSSEMSLGRKCKEELLAMCRYNEIYLKM